VSFHELLRTERLTERPLREKGVAEMQKTQNLQDQFLNQLRKEKAVVTMFLMNGFQLHGVVRGFDGFTVVLDSDGRQQLIYKHAISTVVPPRPIPFDGEE
jgi:host factor-I protein